MTEPDRLRALFRERTLSRIVAISVFLGVLYLFRHLWATLVFFVAFERLIGWIERMIVGRTGWTRTRVVLGIVLALLATFAAVVTASVLSGFGYWKTMQGASTEWIDDLRRNPLFERVQHFLGDTEAVIAHAKDYAGEALKYASAIGRFVIQAMIGFILAIVYRLEAEELDKFEDKIDPRSLVGRLLRWVMHVADAMSVTMQLQLVVGAFNTVTTLPVLIFLGISHIPSLMVLIFVSALVPVIGNLVAGTVLCLLAYQAKGYLGVAIFAVVTFVLHKIESYYLSPRLTARHVRVPSFVLISSLIAFEHLFGFAGVFLSFPALFVAARIRGEFIQEDLGPTPEAAAEAPPSSAAGPIEDRGERDAPLSLDTAFPRKPS